MRRITLACIAVAFLFLGCGNQRIEGPELGPAFDFESTFTEGDVLVNFQVERVQEFQSSKFVFNGSVRNNGADLEGARFEIVSRVKFELPGGGQDPKVEAAQSFGRLISGQTQLIAVSAAVPNVTNRFITGRFASGPPSTGTRFLEAAGR